MAQQPIFSIVLPVHNTSEILLERAIASVLNQSYENWELIIIEDGDCPSLSHIRKKFAASNIIHECTPHHGVSHARNQGISLARGAYIAFLDSDDEFCRDHLSSLYAKIAEQGFPKALFRTGMIHCIRGQRIQTGLYSQTKFKNRIRFILSSFYGVISFCVAKSIFEDFRFNENASFFEDSDFFIRVLLKYPLYQVQKYTCIAHAHTDQSSHRMFFGPRAMVNVESNIRTMQELFEQRPEIMTYLPNGFARQLISDKYLQHANGLLIASNFKHAITCLVRSISMNTKIGNFMYYAKFALKAPFKMISYYTRLD